MSKLLTYSGIVTKIRAMSANLLSHENFSEIAALNSVTDFVSYLKAQPAYADSFGHLDERLLHRGDIEKLLIESLYEDYSKLYSFGSQHIRKFLLLYIRRYEVDLINYCFRITFNHYEQPFDLNYKKPFFDKYSQISINKLVTSSNDEELVENLKGTEYYEPLRKLKNAKAATLFDYNLALDLYYFSTTWKRRKKLLTGQELEMYTKDFGCKMDLLNLQYIYRAKKYFHLDPIDIYAMLIPMNFHIRADQVKQLVEAPTVEEFQKTVDTTYYGKRYDFERPFTLEQIYINCLTRLYTNDCRNYPYSIASINKYLFLKEQEGKKLTTALECIRYGIGPEESLKYIGGVES